MPDQPRQKGFRPGPLAGLLAKRGVREPVIFGLVGLAATATHYAIAVLNVDLLSIPVLHANAIAFAAAFGVSYSGHHRLTFRVRGAHRLYLPRFLTTAALGFCLNQSILFGLTVWLELGHRIALAAALTVVPAASFLVSTFWAFSAPAQPCGDPTARPEGPPSHAA